VRLCKRALTLPAWLLAASAASACDGLIGLGDPTVDSGAQDAAQGNDATTDDAADDRAQASEVDAAAMAEGGALVDVGMDASSSAAEASGSDGESSPDASVCAPWTCTQQGYDCGANEDRCGGVVQCGNCPTGSFCGGGGYSVCGTGSDAGDGGSTTCMPKACAQLGVNCGPTGDGCGNVVYCGTCTPPETCGGGGAPGQCGVEGDP
jgi:hypothetical protein